MDVENLQPQHVCPPGGCGEILRLQWKPDRAAEYVKQLLLYETHQKQVHNAVHAGDVDAACSLFARGLCRLLVNPMLVWLSESLLALDCVLWAEHTSKNPHGLILSVCSASLSIEKL